MAESIQRRVAAMSSEMNKAELLALLLAMHADLVAIATKLDADAGVTDTDYAATIQTTE